MREQDKVEEIVKQGTKGIPVYNGKASLLSLCSLSSALLWLWLLLFLLISFPLPNTLHTHTHSLTLSLSLSLSLFFSLSTSFSTLFLGTHLAKFTIRHVAMELYYASSFYYTLFQRYTDSIVTLAAWAPENVLLGNCTKIPVIDVSLDGESYVAYVGNLANTRVAVVRSDRHLIVRSVWAWSLRNGEKRGLREIVPVCAHMRMSLW